MNVLTPDGRQVVVPDADVSSMISQYGGAILDGGTLPQFEMNDGTIVEASANDAPQLIKSGARLLATQSMRLNDPNGVLRTVPLENISKAAMAGFTLAQQPRVQAESDAEQPGVIGEKTWKTAFQEVGQNITSFLPFLNITDMFKDREIYKITKRQAAGEPLTSYEQNTLEAWQANQARDKSWGYKVASTALRMPAFMGEFILSGAAIEGVAKLGLKRAVGKGVITTIDDMAAPATKAILDHAETAFGASREAMETYAKARLGRAAGMKVALNDIIDAGLVQGKNATKYVTKDAVGAVARNGYEINKAIGNIYATAKIPGATPTTELAQWFLRDNSTELDEAAKLWSSAFWAGAETEASKAAGKKAVEASGRMLARAAVEATIPRAIMQAHRIADTTYQNRIQNVIMKEDDDFLPAFLKAYGDNVIENFSEQTGENMVFLKGMFGKDSKIMLKAAILSDAIPKIAKKKFNGVSELAVKYLLGDNGFLQRTGWNGLIGEMAEEAVGGVLRMGTGIIEPGLPSLSDVSAMAVGFALNPLAGISLVQGARNQNYKDTLAALTKAAEKARASGKVATSEEEIAPVVENLSKAVDALKPGTVVDAEGKQINPATKGIMNFFDGFGKWLTMSKAANKDIVAYADSVSEGRVTAALKSHEKISKDQLKRIALGLIQRRTIAETPEDLRDLNMIDTEAPITFGDQSIKADYEVAYLGKIGDKLPPERVVELTQKYPEFFHAGIVSVDDAGIELASTGKVLEDAEGVNEYLALKNPAAPSTADLTNVAGNLGINAPLTVERESAAKIIQDMNTLTSQGFRIHTMADALIAHPVDEVSGIGYTVFKNASQFTGQELMDTGKVRGMQLDPAKKYVLLHRPGASSGTGEIYATMTQKYQHSSLIEESVESHLKKMFSMNPRIREEAVIGLRQQLDRVNFMLKDDKIPERQRAALEIIAETLSAQAAAKDDRPLIEAFSQFSVGVMGFAQPNLVQKEGGSGAPYYEKTAFTGTRAQQLWREAGLTDEVPAGYAAIYQLPESMALLDRLAARDRAPSKRKIFGEESEAYQSVLKNSGKRYGVEVSMVDGAPVFTPDAAALAKIPSSEAAARHIAGVAKQLYPKKDTTKAQSDYVAKFNAAKAAEFAKEVADVIIPTAETATAKSVAQYEKELEALQDAPGFNEEEFAKLPSVESIKALVKEEEPATVAVEEPTPPVEAVEPLPVPKATTVEDAKDSLTSSGFEVLPYKEGLAIDLSVINKAAGSLLGLPEEKPATEALKALADSVPGKVKAHIAETVEKTVPVDLLGDAVDGVLSYYATLQEHTGTTPVTPQQGDRVAVQQNNAITEDQIKQWVADNKSYLGASIPAGVDYETYARQAAVSALTPRRDFMASVRNYINNQITSSLEIAPVAMMRDEAIVKGNAPGVVNAIMSRINRLLSPADQPEEYDERDGVQYSVTDWAPVDLSRSGVLALLSTALMLRNEKGLQGSAAQIARKANRAEAILRRTMRRTMVDLSPTQLKELSDTAGVSVNTLKEAKIPVLYNQATLKAWAKLAPSWELNRTKLDAADEADLVFKAGHIELTAENRQKRTDEMLKDRMAVARKLGQYAAMVPVDQLQKTIQALMYEYPEAAIAIKDGNSYIQNRSVDGNAIRERITNHFLNVRLASKPNSRAPESNASTTGRSLMLRYELAWTSADLKSDEAKEFIMYSRLPKALVDERYAQFDMDVKNGPLLTQLLSSNVAEQRAAGQAALQSLIEDLVRLPKAAIKEQMRRIQFGNGVAKGSPVDKLLKSLDFLASFTRNDDGSNKTREATRVVEVTEDGTQIKEQVVVVNTKGLSGMVNANNMPLITQLKQKLARDVADFTVNAIRQAPAHETQLEHRYKSTSGASRQGVRNGDYASEVLTQYLKELGPEYSLASIVSSDTDDVSKLTTDEVFKLMQDMWQNEGNIFVPILSGDHRFVRGILYRAPSRDVDYEKVFNTLLHEMHRRMFDKEYPAGQERATLYDNMAAALKRSSQMVSSGLPAILVEDGAASTVYFVEMDTEENGSDYADGAMHGLPGQLAKLSRSFGHSIRDMSHAIKFVVAGQNEDIKQHTTSISKGRRDENPFYEMLASKLEELSSQLPPNTVVLAGSPGAFKTRNPNMLRIKRDGTYVLPSGQVIEPDQALKHLHAVPLGQLRFLSNQDHTGNVQAIRELIDQALAQPGLTPEQMASIEDMRDTADDAFALRNALEDMFKGVTFSYKAPVYLHSAPALTQQVQNIDGLVDPDHKNAAVTRDAIEANVAMVRPRSLAQFLSDNVADLLPDNEQANAIRTLIKSVKQTFGEDRTQELINVVKAYTDEAPDEVRDVMSRIDVIAQDPAFYKALSNVADNPQEYERLLSGMYRDPFDLPGQLQRMNAVIQKATRFMRPSVLTVAVPAHKYGDELLFATAMEHLWNGEAGWVTDHQFHSVGTQYAIASGDYGPSGQVRYARVVKRVDIIGSLDETVSAFIKADPVLFGDLINADGSVRLHEIMTRNTTNDTVDMFIPGSAVDTNRVPGTAGSHFLVRLGYRPRGTTGELATHPELMRRSGADFDVDKWHTYPYLATKIESNDTRIFNQRFVKNLLELYDSPQGQEFLQQAIDLKGFKEALLTTKEIEDAGNKYKNMKPAEFFTLDNWRKATKDTRDPRDVLGAAVASLGGTKSLADNGNLYIDFSVMVRDNTSIMQYLPGYSVQKPSLRSNYYAAEVLHNQNNQILDNTKDPLIAKLGLTKSNVSLITALMFAQQHNSKAEALQRLKLLLDFFNNTPEGQFYIETVTQRSSKVPSVLEIRREKEVNPARMADIISGKKTKETRTWWKAVPAVGQIIEFSDFKGNAQQVKVTKINSNLRQLLYQNKNNWNAIAAGEGWSGFEMYNRYTSQSNEYVVPESVQLEFERIGEPYHLEGSAVTKFLKELAKDMFVQNDAMVRLRNDAVNFGDIVALQEWFTDEKRNEVSAPLYQANAALFHVMKREVYDKVPSLLSRTALQLAGWRPDNMVVGRIAGTMAYHGTMQNPPGIRALGETFNKGVVLQARLANEIYGMKVQPAFARHLLFTGVGGNNVGFQSKYQGEEVLPETIAAAHQEFYEMTPVQQKIVAQYTLATWLPAYTPGSLLELIPPAALAGYTTEWINKTANLWKGSSGSFFNPKFIGYKDTGRIGNSEIPTLLNVDGSVSASKIENLSRGPEVTKPEWIAIPLTINKKSGEINTLSFLNEHDDEKLHTALSSSMIAAAKNGIPSIKVEVARLIAGTPVREFGPPLRPSEKGARGVLYLGNGAPKYLGDVAATYKVPVLELPPSMDSAEQLNAFLNAVQENAGEAPMNIVLVNADGEQLDPVTMQDRKTAYAKLWNAAKELPSSRWRVDGFSRVIGQGSAEAMLEASMPIAKAVAFVGQTTVWTPALNEKGYTVFERTDKLIADAKPTEHAPYLSRGLIDATKPQVTMPDRFTSTSKDGQPVSVYRDPTVGWMAQLDQVATPITDEQALAYYQRGASVSTSSLVAEVVPKAAKSAKELSDDLVRRLGEELPPSKQKWIIGYYEGDTLYSQYGGVYTSAKEAEQAYTDAVAAGEPGIEDMGVISGDMALFLLGEDIGPNRYNKSYEEIAKIVTEWKRDNDIQYDPNDAYSRGEGFYHDIGAFNQNAVEMFKGITATLLAQERKLKAGDNTWYTDLNNRVIVSAYTHKRGGTRPNPGTTRLVIRPSMEDIVWAAIGDVYSGTGRKQDSVNYSGFIVNSDTFKMFEEADIYNPVANSVDAELLFYKNDRPISEAEYQRAYEMAKRRAVKMEAKAPQADKLSMLSSTIAGAIEGRWEGHYNEFGVRLRLGNFYIEEADNYGEWTVEDDPVLGPIFSPKNPDDYFGLSGRSLTRLNKHLKDAFQIVHGSLDPVAPYTPKTLQRAAGPMTYSLDVSGAQALSRERYTQTYQASKELAERFKGVVGRLDQMLKAERYEEALALLDKTNFGGFLDFKKRLQGVVSRARPAPVKRSSPLWYEEDEQREIGYRFGDATGSYIPVMRDYVDPLSNIPRWNSSPSLNYDGQRALFELTGRQKVKTMAFVQSYMAQLAELDTRLGSKTDRLYQYDPKDGRRQTVNAMKRLWDSVVHKKETAFLENGQVEWTAEDQNFMDEVRTSLGLMLDQIQDGADQKKWDDIAAKGVVIQERDIRGQAIVSLRDKGIMSPSAQEILQEANGIVADMSDKSNFDFKIEEKPSGITLKVIATPAKVFEAYAASATKKKLVDAGRAPEELEPQQLVTEFRSLFDSAPADIEELGKEMPYSKKMASRSHYFPHVYHAIGVMSKAEEKEFEAKLKMIRDSGAVLKLDEKQYLEIPKSVFDQSMDLWPDATEFQKQLIARLQRETHAPIGFDGNIVEANKELMRLYYRFFAMRSYDQLKESDKARFNFIAAQDKEFLSNKPQYRIDSGRFKHAVYATFGEAYEKAGLLPKNLDPIEVLRQYVREVFNTAANKNAVMLAATSNSPIDGYPLVVFMPAEGGEAQASIFMPDQYYEAMARSLARSMQKEYNEKLSGIENLKTMATGMAANKDYVSIPVPGYPFFSALYARKGDGWMGHGANAVAAMKNLFGKPASRPWPNFMQNLFANIGRVMGADPDRQALATRDMLKDFMVLTQLMKFNNLAFSPFFGFSAIESFVASEGVKETVRGTRDFKNSIAYYKEVRKQLLNGEFDPRHKRLIANGYTGDTKYDKFDIEMGNPQNMSKWFKEHGGKLGKVAAFLVDRQIAFTEFQFGDLFPVFKYVSSMHMLDEIQNIKDKMGLGELTDEDYHQVAIAMNDGFGGQNWRDFWWATPGTMQAMNLLLFAPNWGISSFRIAGGSILMDKMGIGPEVTQTQIDFIKKTWISMVSLVLMAWPNFLQSMIYGLFGDPDKDKPFTFLNEKGKRMHIDITPLMRKLPWYKGDPSGERREYVRWGKQAYEVYDTKNSWMADVFNLRFDTLQRKLSAPVRLAIELATGKTAGSDWSMDYKDMGLLGIISGEKEGFAGSRMASILSSILPYSISGLSTSSEGLPFSWFGSVSKGTSQFDLEQELTRVLRTYADDATYAELEKNGAAQHRLRGLATNVIEAALANGYDPKAVITSARGAVLKNLYLDILKALDENDESAMKKIAPRILRVNGTLDGVIQSLKTRNRRYMTPVELTPEQTTLLEGVFPQ